MNFLTTSYYDYDYDYGLWTFGVYWVALLIIAGLLLVLNIVAAMRVSKMGGSGVGYFFLGVLYIVCSEKADDWSGFNKIIAVLLGLFTGIGLPIYILAVLKPENANPEPNRNAFAQSQVSNTHSGNYMPKIEMLKKLKADGTITEEEYKRLVLKELEK